MTDVILSIQSRQSYPGQEPEKMELVTEGKLDYRSGGWDVSYAESELTGLEGVTTTFRVEPGKVTLTRSGQLNSQMVFSEGIPHDSLYEMPFGALMLTVTARRVMYDLMEDGGFIDLIYEISIENDSAGTVDYHLEIRKK